MPKHGNLNTQYVHPPIAVRDADWTAYEDPEGVVGRGATELAAVIDYFEQRLEDEATQAAKAISDSARARESYVQWLEAIGLELGGVPSGEGWAALPRIAKELVEEWSHYRKEADRWCAANSDATVYAGTLENAVKEAIAYIEPRVKGTEGHGEMVTLPILRGALQPRNEIGGALAEAGTNRPRDSANEGKSDTCANEKALANYSGFPSSSNSTNPAPATRSAPLAACAKAADRAHEQMAYFRSVFSEAPAQRTEQRRVHSCDDPECVVCGTPGCQRNEESGS
jgi:hypothetical protein